MLVQVKTYRGWRARRGQRMFAFETVSSLSVPPTPRNFPKKEKEFVTPTSGSDFRVFHVRRSSFCSRVGTTVKVFVKGVEIQFQYQYTSSHSPTFRTRIPSSSSGPNFRSLYPEDLDREYLSDNQNRKRLVMKTDPESNT